MCLRDRQVWRDDMELDPVHQRLVCDRSGVCGPPPQRLTVGLSGSRDILRRHCGEGEQLDGVDLDLGPVIRVWGEPTA
jgi:hypothetical protein